MRCFQLCLFFLILYLLLNSRVFAVDFTVLDRNMRPVHGAVVTLLSVLQCSKESNSSLPLETQSKFLSCNKSITQQQSQTNRINFQRATDIDGTLSMTVPVGEYKIIVDHPCLRSDAIVFMSGELVTNQKKYSIRLNHTLSLPLLIDIATRDMSGKFGPNSSISL